MLRRAVVFAVPGDTVKLGSVCFDPLPGELIQRCVRPEYAAIVDKMPRPQVDRAVDVLAALPTWPREGEWFQSDWFVSSVAMAKLHLRDAANASALPSEARAMHFDIAGALIWNSGLGRPDDRVADAFRIWREAGGR